MAATSGVVVLSIITLSILLLSPLSLIEAVYAATCIKYDSSQRLITITCSFTNLSNIAKELNYKSVLSKESTTHEGLGGSTVWLLNAHLTIEKGATLYINSTDTAWLKIISKGTNAYEINVKGNLNVDSVKITSWNPKTNDYAKTTKLMKEPRGFIRATEGGAINITNSEIAYLGYDSGGIGTQHGGLTYIRSNEGLVSNNHIHHMWVGFFSDKSSNIVIENNHVHHDLSYGLDPHTKTHDIIIRNNKVHNNGNIGIICSEDCYNITIENNEVYKDRGYEIMLSKNMTHSIVRNNKVHDGAQCIISVGRSHYNEVYNNTISYCEYGISLGNSSNSKIHHNTIINSTINAILIKSGASYNAIYSNKIVNTTQFAIGIRDMHSIGNRFYNNQLINSRVQKWE
jgi:mannuronan 5-epimerase